MAKQIGGDNVTQIMIGGQAPVKKMSNNTKVYILLAALTIATAGSITLLVYSIINNPTTALFMLGFLTLYYAGLYLRKRYNDKHK